MLSKVRVEHSDLDWLEDGIAIDGLNSWLSLDCQLQDESLQFGNNLGIKIKGAQVFFFAFMVQKTTN